MRPWLRSRAMRSVTWFSGCIAAAVPVQRVKRAVRGKRGVTPETAWLLAQAFETTPDFWLNLQAAYDLARTRPERMIPPLKSAS